MLFYFGRFLFRVLFKIFCRWEVRGGENVPTAGGVILAPNHTSHLDPPLVGSAIARPVNFMAKRELFAVPIFGNIIRHTRAFPISRDRPDKEALKKAYALLAAGEILVMFPEGTRSPDGRLQKPETGLAMIAAKAGVPVVPVALIGSNRALPKGSFLLRPAKIKVQIGAPLCYHAPVGADSRGAREAFAKQIMQGIAQMLPPEMQAGETAVGINHAKEN